MKYLVLLCDGMADTPVAELGGKTPMEVAKKPVMDRLSGKSLVGMAKTVPEGMKPGSDVANLSAMGYHPATCYTGRSPLEAASIGISLKPNEYAIRCNLVTLSGEPSFADKTMVDYCADDISTAEADELVQYLKGKLPHGVRLHTGVSYRHCLVWENTEEDLGELTPPHDISGRKISEYLPDSDKAGVLLELMVKSCSWLCDHPVNQKRIAAGRRPANAMWLWGAGRRADIPSFEGRYKVKGAVISAVDLIKGIGILSGMEVIEVPGATGYLDTNFSGKAEAAIDAFRQGTDLVYLHIEAPDECGHRGEVEEKVRSIEIIDREVLQKVEQALRESGEDYRILVLPDHPTPLATKTHSSDPVPFFLYDSRKAEQGTRIFTEAEAEKTGNFYPDGSKLMALLLSE